MTRIKSLGLYIHIPFCRSKCLYCDFCSLPNRSAKDHEAYVNALCRDLSTRAAACREHTVDTVYLGGGTPTHLSPTLLVRILETVFKNYRVSANAEITLECNPATANRDAFGILRGAGFNRISIGLQSAHAEELRALGRLHSFDDLKNTISDARAAGFENVSVDVMFGIPHQTLQSYLQTIERLTTLSPEHISAYGLTIEDGTPFGKAKDRLPLPDEEETRQMYLKGIETLRAHGYDQYEISNFSKRGYQSRHNLKYWNCEEYLGFGPAAYSDFGNQRFGNSRDQKAYLDGNDILAESETPSQEERLNEYVMLRLRLCDGIDENEFAARYGCSFEERFGTHMARYEAGGFVRRTQNGWALTAQGFYVSNTILCELLDFSE